MKKLILIICLFVFCGCSSAPKRNLSTMNGVISAYFNITESNVKSLRKKSYDDNSIIKILIIQTSSYLTIDEILSKINEEKSLDEIASGVGIEPGLLQERSDKITQEILEPKDLSE